MKKDTLDMKFWIKGRIRNGEFLRIFTVAFLLFIAPAGGSNPVGPLTLRALINSLPNQK